MSDNLHPLPASPNRSKGPSSPHGFFCPNCKARAGVDRPLVIDDTRRRAPSIVARYRKCSVCLYREVTFERHVRVLRKGRRVIPV